PKEGRLGLAERTSPSEAPKEGRLGLAERTSPSGAPKEGRLGLAERTSPSEAPKEGRLGLAERTRAAVGTPGKGRRPRPTFRDRGPQALAALRIHPGPLGHRPRHPRRGDARRLR